MKNTSSVSSTSVNRSLAVQAFCLSATLGLVHTACAAIVPTGDVTPVYNNTDPWNTGGFLGIGLTGTGSLEVNAGSSVIDNVTAIGNDLTGDGTLTVTGTNSTFTSGALLSVAGSGTGELNVEAGGLVDAGAVAMAGGATALSTSTVTGADSQLDVAFIAVVGGAINPFNGDIGPGGDATLSVNSGGAVTIGDAATPLASSLVISDMDASGDAGGSLTVFGGGQIDVADDTVIGQGFNEHGWATFTGAGAELTHGLSGLLVVGENGTGTLNLEAGATASASVVILGRESGEGTANISGSGSVLSANLFDVAFGSGSLNITDGGRLSTSGSNLGIFANNVDVTISGDGSEWENTGSLNVGFVGAGANILVEDGGVLKSNGALLTAPDSGATVVDITGMGSEWQENGTLRVGLGASGTINVADKGTLTTTTLVTLGQNENGSGTINVTGSDSQWVHSGSLFMGFEDGANGFVNISQGGTALIASATIGGGDSSDTAGVVTVNGGGSRLDASGSVDVGGLGSGTLEVTNGGVAVIQSVGIATSASSLGVVTVRDASSLLRAKDELRVGGGFFGAGGDGTLNIESGGRVRVNDTNFQSTLVGLDISGDGPMPMDGVTMTVYAGGTINNDTNASIGSNAGEYGTAVVTGAGATWNNGGYLEVGLLGTGTLTVEAGGVVNSTDGILGNFASGSGSATVTGGGSRWDMSGDLDVGLAGAGTLTIETGGVVAVTGTSSIGANGAVDLTGGRFEFGTMSPADFGVINGVSGALAGVVDIEAVFFGVNDVDDLANVDFLSGFANIAPAVDTSEVTFSSYSNSGTILGNGVSNLEITNNADGSLVASSFETMRFEANGVNNGLYAIQVGQISFGGRVTNNASINLSNNTIENGRLTVDGDLDNESTGTIRGEGIIQVGGTFTNRGAMNLNEDSMDIHGAFVNDSGGSVLTTGGGTTTFFDSVEHNGDPIETGAGSSTVFRGEYSGAGLFTGVGLVRFEGPVNLGNSPAEVTFAGDVALAGAADTTIELGGLLAGEFDRFDIAGAAAIDGDLLVSLINGFMPSLGDSFEILTAAGGLTGEFDTGLLTDLGGGLGWDVLYDSDSVELLVVPLNGDFDADGDVDVADALLGQRWGASLDSWAANFGNGEAVVLATSVVPEPTAFVMAVAGFVVALRRKR